ncbi:hypothetical protein SJAG_05224 [Schizosaccharomyces japonicus yFS275]|uniref:Splicing factor Cactin n=1 Tax=Schizosaccharomyces japonicus (strain yFS275 / FY16936) TaxID=402676 RepID=B6K0A2_SCHJY|nr:hypothetical protein SJAG_05224 [Schizosaccharomyces japonicus yFS275]EEB06252.2 hypothetical protein SJAG_05224 [Schizosaccharomyces japonicus yFS275]
MSYPYNKRSSSRSPSRYSKRFRERDDDLSIRRHLTSKDTAENELERENKFLLIQYYERAALRLSQNRSKPIDHLLVSISTILGVDERVRHFEPDLMSVCDPIDLIENNSVEELETLGQQCLELERLEGGHREKQKFWLTVHDFVDLELKKARASRDSKRSIAIVLDDVQKLLQGKSHEALVRLENQIKQKLRSNAPIDTDYWEGLLLHLKEFKVRAYLSELFSETLQQNRTKQNEEQLQQAKDDLHQLQQMKKLAENEYYRINLDPAPLLRQEQLPQGLKPIEEEQYTHMLETKRKRVTDATYIPLLNSKPKVRTSKLVSTSIEEDTFWRMTKERLEREYLKAGDADEADLENELETEQAPVSISANGVSLKKPKYYNRVLLGFEWNSYNQAHYNEEHPPPKAVQGYRFNIFYPDLIGTGRAPTYRIERNRSRKQRDEQQTEETCVIRFIAGEPYQDIAFRIVDRDWDYSSKRHRGFKNSFENGVLCLHFQFKRVYYKK